VKTKENKRGHLQEAQDLAIDVLSIRCAATDNTMNDSSDPNRPERSTGLVIRLAALSLDWFVIWLAASAVSALIRQLDVYWSLELTFLTLMPVYLAVTSASAGLSFGKACFAVRVQTPQGHPVGLARALLRELPGKILFFALLPLALLLMVLRKDRRGLHDLLAGTCVRWIQPSSRALRRQRHFAVLASFFLLAWCFGPAAYWVWFARRVEASVSQPLPYELRSRASPITLTPDKPLDLQHAADWVSANGQGPADYILAKAKRHQLLLLGEIHYRKAPLDLFNQLIPRLYHEAGVRCIALEVCASADNSSLCDLVTAKSFDQQRALQIARHGDPWKTWGAAEHWRILQTVWQLNHTLPLHSQPMRVIGLGFEWDGPSFALMSAGPPIERFRFLRVCDDLIQTSLTFDARAAEQLEQEVFAKGEKAAVWIGATHSTLSQRAHIPTPFGGALAYSSMGTILRQRHPDEVFQICMHPYASTEGLSAGIGQLIHSVQALRNHAPVGFDVAASPFGLLRDPNDRRFANHPAITFADFASGYVYLAPVDRLQWCTWMDGYITNRMIATHLPYYRLMLQQDIRTADDIDRAAREPDFWPKLP